MEIDAEDADATELYRLLSGAVVPRPIAWVSTVSEDGVGNLAPFSFFNAVSVQPPVVMFAPVRRDGGLKNTPSNVVETEEFVVNVVTMDLAEEMNETSASLEAEENEFEHVGIENTESTRVDPPRVADSDVSFECVLHDFVDVGASSMVLGKVVVAHVDGSVTTDGKLDVTKLDAVGRLAGSYYSTTRERFRMERPP